MHVRDEIRLLRLSPALLGTLRDVLKEVASADGSVDPSEARAIVDLLGSDVEASVHPEPLEALWPHAEVLIRACVVVSLADGEYSVQEARTVSALAHRLGISARKLAEVEDGVYRELRPPAPPPGEGT